MSKRQVTLAEYLVGRVGLRRATNVAAFIAAWGIYSEQSPAPHSMDGYASFWKMSVATAYRERDVFRMCFPAERVPDRVWASVRRVYDAKAGREVVGARLLSATGEWSDG